MIGAKLSTQRNWKQAGGFKLTYQPYPLLQWFNTDWSILDGHYPKITGFTFNLPGILNISVKKEGNIEFPFT